MDTEAIASEIVYLKNRLQELDADVEGGSGSDVDDERNRLVDRMRELQHRFADHETAEELEPHADETQPIRPV